MYLISVITTAVVVAPCERTDSQTRIGKPKNAITVTLSSQGNFTDLNEFLQKNMEILMRNPAHLGNVLETLDIQQHSLGVLAVMSAKLQQSTINDWEELLNRLTIFIMDCNGEQIRYAAQR